MKPTTLASGEDLTPFLGVAHLPLSGAAEMLSLGVCALLGEEVGEELVGGSDESAEGGRGEALREGIWMLPDEAVSPLSAEPVALLLLEFVGVAGVNTETRDWRRGSSVGVLGRG